MNKLLIATLALLAITVFYTTTRVDRKSQFENWKSKHGFKYSATEDLYRFEIYAKAMEEIEAHNADPTQTYKQGENQFTAMTKEEFVQFLTFKPSQNRGKSQVYKAPEDFQPLGAVNWSSKVRVKNQGLCGSCWAFSAVAGVEAFYKIKHGVTLDLSEQSLVDCVYEEDYDGCEGGQETDAFDFITEYGIVDSETYPYISGETEEGGFCEIDFDELDNYDLTFIEGYQAVDATAASVKSAVSNYPLTVTVDATNWSRYKSGVFSNCAKDINHALLLVGYNEDSTWILKNSWGTSWGVQGFITLSAGNTCGVISGAGFAY